jgi:organic radical activating enzyme
VQIETSGAVHQDLEAVYEPPDLSGDGLARLVNLSVVVSPKTTTLKYKGWVDAWKYVVRAGEIDDEDGLPTGNTQTPGRATRIARPLGRSPVYLQPCYEADPDRYQANIDAAIKTCIKHGYRLSLQTHKILGLP